MIERVAFAHRSTITNPRLIRGGAMIAANVRTTASPDRNRYWAFMLDNSVQEMHAPVAR